MWRGKYPTDFLGIDISWTYLTWCPQYENLHFPGKHEKFKYNNAWNSEGQIIVIASGKTGPKAVRKLLVLGVTDGNTRKPASPKILSRLFWPQDWQWFCLWTLWSISFPSRLHYAEPKFSLLERFRYSGRRHI